MLGSVGMMLVMSLVFIDRDLITISHARVCGHDAGYVINVYCHSQQYFSMFMTFFFLRQTVPDKNIARYQFSYIYFIFIYKANFFPVIILKSIHVRF
jgi:hypothetical protein